MSELKFIKKRKVPRREFFSTVGVLSKGKYDLAESFEIGEQGIAITSPFDLEKDNRIVVSLNILGGVTLIVKGIVRYAKDKNGVNVYGIEFYDIDFDMKRHIRYYVASGKATKASFAAAH